MWFCPDLLTILEIETDLTLELCGDLIYIQIMLENNRSGQSGSAWKAGTWENAFLSRLVKVTGEVGLKHLRFFGGRIFGRIKEN